MCLILCPKTELSSSHFQLEHYMPHSGKDCGLYLEWTNNIVSFDSGKKKKKSILLIAQWSLVFLLDLNSFFNWVE